MARAIVWCFALGSLAAAAWAGEEKPRPTAAEMALEEVWRAPGQPLEVAVGDVPRGIDLMDEPSAPKGPGPWRSIEASILGAAHRLDFPRPPTQDHGSVIGLTVRRGLDLERIRQPE